MFPDGGGHAKIFMVKRVNVRKKIMNAYQYSLYTSSKRNNIQIIEINKQIKVYTVGSSDTSVPRVNTKL